MLTFFCVSGNQKCITLFRIEDLTDPEELRQNPKCDRQVSFYGYVRGANIKPSSKIHLLGNKNVKNILSLCFKNCITI